jgi:hypothetical protein
MPHQTPLSRDGQVSPTEGVRHGLAGLLHDVMTLAELQFKLLAVDARDASMRAVAPLALLSGAAVFALSALPLLLIALAQLLRDQAGWAPALATFVAVIVGLVFAALLAGAGILLLRRCLEPFVRSRDEFNRNVTWLKSALKRHEIQQQAAATVPPGSSVPPGYPR